EDGQGEHVPADVRHLLPGWYVQADEDRVGDVRGRGEPEERREDHEQQRANGGGDDRPPLRDRPRLPALLGQAGTRERRPHGGAEPTTDAEIARQRVSRLPESVRRGGLQAGRRGSGSGSRRRLTGSSRSRANARSARCYTTGSRSEE